MAHYHPYYNRNYRLGYPRAAYPRAHLYFHRGVQADARRPGPHAQQQSFTCTHQGQDHQQNNHQNWQHSPQPPHQVHASQDLNSRAQNVYRHEVEIYNKIGRLRAMLDDVQLALSNVTDNSSNAARVLGYRKRQLQRTRRGTEDMEDRRMHTNAALIAIDAMLGALAGLNEKMNGPIHRDFATLCSELGRAQVSGPYMTPEERAMYGIQVSSSTALTMHLPSGVLLPARLRAAAMSEASMQSSSSHSVDMDCTDDSGEGEGAGAGGGGR